MAKPERNALPLLSAAVAVFALIVAGIAVVAANNSDGGGGGGSSGGSGPVTIDVTLADFSITPKEITAPPGEVTFSVQNNGTQVHNFQIEGVGGTRDLQPGQSTTVTLDLAAGSYNTICTIAGHAAAGMVGTITVAEGATAGGSGGTNGEPTYPQSWEEMDAAMDEVAEKFLQVNGLAEPRIEMKDWGKENGELAPRMEGDVKVFDLESKVVDWEVEPGKMVKAWTYNGIVPGPIIRANPGDKIRINLLNNLPESTTLHPHGCDVPNSMDGFDPYTQSAIKPGESFTYEWTIPTGATPGVCMYHSHHNAQVQVPNGLVGALLIGEMPLPAKFAESGDTDGDVEQEVVMVLNDAGNIGLSLNGRSFPGTQGYLAKQGETMLVHYYNEGLQIHPMHLHAPHGLIIAKDGVPLDAPFMSDTINVAPGERWSVLYTFSEPGVWAWHCHILTHAETPFGFRYMATAVVVQ